MIRRLRSLVIFVGLLSGCSGSGPRTEVSGTVMLNGQPLADAQVQLVPKTDSALGLHVGQTNSAGHFTITQAAANNPVKSGVYVVLVSKLAGGNDPSQPGGGMEAQKNVVPELYQDRNKSPFTADVHEGVNILEPFQIVTPKK
ncbi:MAG: DUF4198 domain-containing protein [Planctomycetes bacterium]|nr:DUF4198 domain-containing protein [Planctomycetota bacterium]